MRKLIITALIAAAIVALVSATAVALLGMPEDVLVYAMNTHDLPARSSNVPLWVPT